MTCIEITSEDLKILMHALGLDTGNRQYRNRYVSPMTADVERLANAGLMERHKVPGITNTVYRVSRDGASLVMDHLELHGRKVEWESPEEWQREYGVVRP